MASKTNIKNPKFLFISANHAPLFLHRYIEAKHEAEKKLDSLPNIRFQALRPGFLYSRERLWSLPLSTFITFGVLFFNPILRLFSSVWTNSSKYLFDTPNSRDDLVKALVYLALNDSEKKKVLLGPDIVELSKKFDTFNIKNK